jgi:hypothetical protein
VETADRAFHFELNRAFSEETSQDAVYDYVGRPVVCDVLDGYNGTIFAYGQTGSGKTYCMFGPESCRRGEQGIVPRTAEQVFDQISALTDDSSEFTLRCSFLEVYREQMRDLLDPDNQGLKVKELPQRGLYVHGLTREYVTCPDEVMHVLGTGNRARAIARTRLNEHSSRSHAIFMLQVEQRSSEGTERLGKLTLVDLAGSEKVGKSGCVGETLEEAKKINWSLSALGKVIDALAEQRPHVPYRDSRLTRVLEEALGGNCRTTLLVAASPLSQHYDETLSSMRFATRAKAVRNHAKVNYMYSSDQLLVLVARLQRELAGANKQLAYFTNPSPADSIKEVPRADSVDREKPKAKMRLRVPLEQLNGVDESKKATKDIDEMSCGSPDGATSCGSPRSVGSSPISEAFQSEELGIESAPACINDELWRPVAIAARDAVRSMEAVLLAQERALEEAGLLRSDTVGRERGAAGSSGRSAELAPEPGVSGRSPMSRRSSSHSSSANEGGPQEGGQPLDGVALSERWRALRHAVDARSLHWRLQVERHKNETLALELEMRKRHTEELEQHLERLHGRQAVMMQDGAFDGKVDDFDDSLIRLLSRIRKTGAGGSCSSSQEAARPDRREAEKGEASTCSSARHPRIARPILRGRGTLWEVRTDSSVVGAANATGNAVSSSAVVHGSPARKRADTSEAVGEALLSGDSTWIQTSCNRPMPSGEDILPMAGTGEAVSTTSNALTAPRHGSSDWSSQFEKYMSSTHSRWEAQVSELHTELEGRSHQIAELAAELAARDVRISALRHEVRVRDALLGHLREDSLRRAEHKDDEVERLVEQAMLPLTTILSTRQAAAAAAAGERTLLVRSVSE